MVTKGQFTCNEWGRYGVTDRRTPVHVGPSGSSAVTGHIAAGERVRGYYRCINSAGNVWYEITGNLGNDMEEKDARFIYSGYL
ncbi:hypothetical protein [Streptomyces boninensis]|uniref:hypothetical protein n=1 Tax=Streptomyces boninensis TaxID=2039455 RepID=UPI003B21BFDB